jgi:hypothetical protein
MGITGKSAFRIEDSGSRLRETGIRLQALASG